MNPKNHTTASYFEAVKAIGLALPGVEEAVKYDGSPLLKLKGSFMAGLATHHSADDDTLVVRLGMEERARFIEDAPDTYYLTDHYRPYELILVRLPLVGPEILRELLLESWRITARKKRNRRTASSGLEQKYDS